MEDVLWEVYFKEIITYRVCPRIQTITSLTKVQNTLGIIELESRQWTVIIVWLLHIIKVTVEELRESDAYVFFLFNLNLIKLLFTLFTNNFFWNWRISFVDIPNDQILEETPKFMKLNFEITRAIFLLAWLIELCIRTHKADALIIKLFYHKNLTRLQIFSLMIGHDTQPVPSILEFLKISVDAHLIQILNSDIGGWHACDFLETLLWR